MTPPILELINFSKSFRSHWTFQPKPAVDDISLSVEAGEAFGFLGHNGAGKTTTIKCIVGLIHKSSGRILYQGREIAGADRSTLGYLPELPYFYNHLSVEETLSFFTALHGFGRRERSKLVAETLERVGLADRKRSSVRSLSKGLQQRLGLAQAIVNRPKLLLLDEPFSGLDPIGRLEVRNLILEMKRAGTTLLLSSHILSDVENICDRVSIMAKGRLKTVFRLADAPQLYGESYQLVLEGSAGQDLIAEQLGKLAQPGAVGGHYSFANYKSAAEALRLAIGAGIKVRDFSSSGPNLETIFMKITGHYTGPDPADGPTGGESKSGDPQ